jgi:hypothetical protein
LDIQISDYFLIFDKNKQTNKNATSVLCECGSGAARRRALRGPCLCSNPPGKKREKKKSLESIIRRGGLPPPPFPRG